MAFAQFYYDPALEFEKLLDDDSGGSEPQGTVAPIVAAAEDDSKVVKSTDHSVIARSASMTAETVQPQPRQLEGRRWFGEGLLRRWASTGSVHDGTPPGVPK